MITSCLRYFKVICLIQANQSKLFKNKAKNKPITQYAININSSFYQSKARNMVFEKKTHGL